MSYASAAALLWLSAALVIASPSGLLGVDQSGGALQHVQDALRFPANLQEHIREAVAKDPALAAEGEACIASLQRWTRGLISSEQWALQMLDSSSSLMTGFAYGNRGDLGNFDECVASVGEDFSGRYALPFLTIQTAIKIANGRGTVGDMGSRVTQALRAGVPPLPGEGEYEGLLGVHMAVCVPSACPERVLQAALGAAVDAANGRHLNGTGLRLSGQLPPGSTSVAGPSRSVEARDWAVGLVYSMLTHLFKNFCGQRSLNVVLADSRRQKASAFLVFSAKRNAKLLFAPAADDNFSCIDGFRALMAVCVVLSHRYFLVMMAPVVNLVTLLDTTHTIYSLVVLGAILSVDTFLLIGGMVNSYVFMRVVHRSGSFSWLDYYLRRYLRLTPAFALVVAFTATWFSLLGTGPMWNSVVGMFSEDCRRNWWSALLYVDIYTDPDHRCMMQGWYLVTDMQLHWLSPLLLYPLLRWRRAGLAWLCFLMAASAAAPAAMTYVGRLRAPISLVDFWSDREFLRKMYYPPYMRATPYVFGTLMGYVLFLIKSGKIKASLGKRTALLGWACSVTLCLAVILAALPLLDKAHHPYRVAEHALYAGLHRIAWALGVSWVLMACILGYGGIVNTLLSCRTFTVLARLGYGIYLTHSAIQMIDVGTTRTPYYYSEFKMVSLNLLVPNTSGKKKDIILETQADSHSNRSVLITHKSIAIHVLSVHYTYFSRAAGGGGGGGGSLLRAYGVPLHTLHCMADEDAVFATF
ncbi:hypothetical protein ONE63_007328 [Megalurothrips usitatus]|uniref:Nose resistant-to-fluoxetine protein N-terminal domain-containing protein n=1 Tax=Megalurothrips usitatus TaxID=439358 RepID=A0AAV7XVT0_9NEOP|nr:hypothetical protein ONE63_007328 [Megalurothrips usitatus]